MGDTPHSVMTTRAPAVLKIDYLLPIKLSLPFANWLKKNYCLWSLFTFSSCNFLQGVREFFKWDVCTPMVQHELTCWPSWSSQSFHRPQTHLRKFTEFLEYLYMLIRHCWRVQHEIKLSFGHNVNCNKDISLYSLLVLTTKGLTPTLLWGGTKYVLLIIRRRWQTHSRGRTNDRS